MLRRLLFFAFIFYVYVFCCGCNPEVTGPRYQKTDTIEIIEETGNIEDAKRVIVMIGDPTDSDNNPLVCGLSFTITFFENDDDQLTDTVLVENFSESYLISEMVDPITGTDIIKDYSCPRSIGIAMDNGIDIPCHIEEHTSGLHFKRGEELAVSVENCGNSVYLSCGLCEQVLTTIPVEQN